jgi:glycosyltransferase involved in cell wall biosynthesis
MKAGAFAAADLFVLPSFSENFGIAAAEALMAGLPCVLGKGVALADEVEVAGAGLGVEPEPASMAGALVQIMKSEPLRLEMSNRAVALAREKYSMKTMGKNLAGLYEDILSRQGAARARDS